MTRSTTRRKSTTTRSKARPKGDENRPTPPPADAEPGAGPSPDRFLRKKELIERVVTQSGLKKKDVKPVVEATLAVLGEALAKQEPMNLQPFGKLIVNRRKEQPNAEVLITRIRRPRQSVEEVGKDPLADPDE
ncbi:MAG: HU family DNA-binding protein [Paracoccaceae bacterium]